MTNVADAAPTAPAAAEDWRRRELLAAYVGPAWPQYERTYQRLLEGRSGFGWDWDLFFIPWIWLTYRKLYVPAVVVWLLDVLPRPVGWWIAAATLLAHVAVAAYGPAFFLKRAIAEVDRVRAASPSEPVAFDRLNAGGTARTAGFLGVFLPLLILAAMISTTDLNITFTN
jgi:hypothetical protein